MAELASYVALRSSDTINEMGPVLNSGYSIPPGHNNSLGLTP